MTYTTVVQLYNTHTHTHTTFSLIVQIILAQNIQTKMQISAKNHKNVLRHSKKAKANKPTK